MMLTTKRSADDAWEQGDRVRTALGASTDELCTQMVVTPTLPADCWGIVMEFVLNRRTMATFGAGRTINKPIKYWPRRPYKTDPTQLYNLRLVSRTWCRLASALVRSIVLDNYDSSNIEHPTTLATTFPNARYIDITAGYCDYSAFAASLAADLEQNTARRLGRLHPPGYPRIHVCPDSFIREKFRQAVGENDTIFQAVTDVKDIARALSNADVIKMYGFYNNEEIYQPETNFTLRATTILVWGGDEGLFEVLFKLLATIDADIRKNTTIYSYNPKLVSFVRDHCRNLGIPCVVTDPNASPAENTFARRQARAINNVFR